MTSTNAAIDNKAHSRYKDCAETNQADWKNANIDCGSASIVTGAIKSYQSSGETRSEEHHRKIQTATLFRLAATEIRFIRGIRG
jgi:hypothetical protein